MRRYLATFLCLILAAPVLAQPEKPRVTIAVGGKAALYYLPLTLAERLGYFEDEGLQVEILDFPGGARSLQALMGGSVDVVSGGFDHTIMMQGRGQAITAFVLQGETPAISLGVSKALSAKWQGLQSLKGMKVGVTAPGSSTHMFVNSLLARGGLARDDVAIIGVGSGPGAVASMQAGRLDAIANIEPAITLLERSGAIDVKVETVSEQGAKALYGAALPSGCLYTRPAFINRYPNTVQALTNAMVRALKWLHAATPEQVAGTVPVEYLLGDRELYLAAYAKQRPGYSKTGRFAQERVQAMHDALAGFEPLLQSQRKIELQNVYTNRFVDAALSAIR
ncbi:MAG TPA: ABC transporter substrate-binding protein [Burkholderiales bacterium]|nr:ABC transporter substrate-binding protein [Burkholderiales bacterium]